MFCECLERFFLDSEQCVVAMGWLKARPEFNKSFWVSVKERPIRLFDSEEEARIFYGQAIHRIKNPRKPQFRIEHKRTLKAIGGAYVAEA